MSSRDNKLGITQPIRGMGQLAIYTELVGHVACFVHSFVSARSRLHGDFMPIRLTHLHLHDDGRALDSVHDCLYDLRELGSHENSDHVEGIADLVRVLRNSRRLGDRRYLWVAQECLSHAIHLAETPSHEHALLVQLNAHLALEIEDHVLFHECLALLDSIELHASPKWANAYACRSLVLRGLAGHGHVHELGLAVRAALAAENEHGSVEHVGYMAARSLLVHGLAHRDEHSREHVATAIRMMQTHFHALAEEFLPIDEHVHGLIGAASEHVHELISSHDAIALRAWLEAGLRSHGPVLEHALGALHGSPVTA